MMDWFMAGGWGMWTILAAGVASIGYGAKAVREPSAERLAVLRGLPALIGTMALFTFGTDLWAVNRALSNESWQKAHNIAAGDLPVIGLVGLTESGQAFTLGAFLAIIVIALRLVADAKHARS